jgi:hypothetical protein
MEEIVFKAAEISRKKTPLLNKFGYSCYKSYFPAEVLVFTSESYTYKRKYNFTKRKIIISLNCDKQ